MSVASDTFYLFPFGASFTFGTFLSYLSDDLGIFWFLVGIRLRIIKSERLFGKRNTKGGVDLGGLLSVGHSLIHKMSCVSPLQSDFRSVAVREVWTLSRNDPPVDEQT